MRGEPLNTGPDSLMHSCHVAGGTNSVFLQSIVLIETNIFQRKGGFGHRHSNSILVNYQILF